MIYKTKPINDDELDFMGEGFAPEIPKDIEMSCNETVDKI